MRVSDFVERKYHLDVSRYAPPQYRVPAGEATIRPILERLSRGISQDDPNSASALSVPPAEPIHAQDAFPPPKIPLSMTERLAVVMGLAAVLATVSVTFIQSKAEHPASAASADTSETAETSDIADRPKKVHTVTVRPAPTMVAEAQSSTVAKQPAPPPAQSGASVADRIRGGRHEAGAAASRSRAHARGTADDMGHVSRRARFGAMELFGRAAARQ